ncbi:MAG: hypothetical protein FWG52_02130 [Proteobacteria bacterium]|nr:hypothetical protein [Pseudomonadota bacterium]
MKHLFVCLLMGCLASPTWGAEPTITFEEFLQKLEKAEPWEREKVEALLGVKFTEPKRHYRTVYMAYGEFLYAKGLIVREISFEVAGDTNETNMLIFDLDDKSGCFTRERVKKLYPGGYWELGSPESGPSYNKKMPWGEWGFRFGPEKKYDCVTDFGIITNAFIKYRDNPSPPSSK